MIDVSKGDSSENLQLVISEYEKLAVKSRKRNAVLATSYDSMSKAAQMAEQAMEILRNSQGTKKNTLLETIRESKTENLGFEFDLFDAVDDESFFKQCMNCNGRVNFDFQVRPLEVLGPIASLLQQIDLSVGRLEDRVTDSERVYDQLCSVLQSLSNVCGPDLMRLLMSINLLLQQYLLDQIKIKLDWTTIIGPILKAIIGAITGLLNGVVGPIVLSPLNCTLSEIMSARKINNAIAAVAGNVPSVLNEWETLVKQPFEDAANGEPQSEFSVRGGSKEYSGVGFEYSNSGTNTVDHTTFFDDKLIGGTISQKGKTTDLTKHPMPAGLPTSIEFSSIQDIPNLPNALSKNMLGNNDPLGQLLIVGNQARAWITGLLASLNQAATNIDKLVGGGLSFQIDQLGIILALFDVINLLQTIVKMVKEKPNVTDWCSELKSNPSIFLKAAGFDEQSARISVTVDDIQIQRDNLSPVTVKLCNQSGYDFTSYINSTINGLSNS